MPVSLKWTKISKSSQDQRAENPFPSMKSINAEIQMEEEEEEKNPFSFKSEQINTFEQHMHRTAKSKKREKKKKNICTTSIFI